MKSTTTTTTLPKKADGTTGGGGPDGKNKNEEGILGTSRENCYTAMCLFGWRPPR